MTVVSWREDSLNLPIRVTPSPLARRPRYPRSCEVMMASPAISPATRAPCHLCLARGSARFRAPGSARARRHCYWARAQEVTGWVASQ